MNAVPNSNFAQCVETIEASYEYLLAYAAQGRESEPKGGGSGPSVRQFVSELHSAVSKIAGAGRSRVAELKLVTAAEFSLHAMSLQLEQDAARAQTVINAVLAAPALSSQLVDNLNASAHLRCLLTSIFIMDEVLQQHARAEKN